MGGRQADVFVQVRELDPAQAMSSALVGASRNSNSMPRLRLKAGASLIAQRPPKKRAAWSAAACPTTGGGLGYSG